MWFSGAALTSNFLKILDKFTLSPLHVCYTRLKAKCQDVPVIYFFIQLFRIEWIIFKRQISDSSFHRKLPDSVSVKTLLFLFEYHRSNIAVSFGQDWLFVCELIDRRSAWQTWVKTVNYLFFIAASGTEMAHFTFKLKFKSLTK